ncbi:SufE family protein [Orbus sturtevantii]|uniref:SufE family protein n=1 Tax=Orbus sturtevantii TaxID=3074109 RepID=UPI00370D907B
MELNSTELRIIFDQLSNWQDRYRHIIQLAKVLPNFPEEQRIISNQIEGCENKVWLTYKKNSKQILTFTGDSEGRIVKGLLAIIIILANNKTAEQIAQTDFLFELKAFKIIDELSQSRQLGLYNIIQRIKLLASNH